MAEILSRMQPSTGGATVHPARERSPDTAYNNGTTYNNDTSYNDPTYNNAINEVNAKRHQPNNRYGKYLESCYITHWVKYLNMSKFHNM